MWPLNHLNWFFIITCLTKILSNWGANLPKLVTKIIQIETLTSERKSTKTTKMMAVSWHEVWYIEMPMHAPNNILLKISKTACNVWEDTYFPIEILSFCLKNRWNSFFSDLLMVSLSQKRSLYVRKNMEKIGVSL